MRGYSYGHTSRSSCLPTSCFLQRKCGSQSICWMVGWLGQWELFPDIFPGLLIQIWFPPNGRGYVWKIWAKPLHCFWNWEKVERGHGAICFLLTKPFQEFSSWHPANLTELNSLNYNFPQAQFLSRKVVLGSVQGKGLVEAQVVNGLSQGYWKPSCGWGRGGCQIPTERDWEVLSRDQ